MTQVPQQSVNHGRWEFLDAARGIAALMVLVQHGIDRWSPQGANFTNRHFDLGEAAVVAFFFVSGFIIPVSLERYASAKKFWIGRAFRLLPMYLLSFAVVLILHAIGRDPFPVGASEHWYRFILGNATMTQDFLRVPQAIGSYWTLTYEVIFYVLCTLLMAAGLLRRSFVIAISGCLGYLAITLLSAALWHRSISADKACLILTAFAGTLFYRRSVSHVSREKVAAVLVALAVTIPVALWLRLVRYPKAGDFGIESFAASMAAWFVGYAVFGLLYYGRRCEFPRVFLWLGRISYSIYLLHGIIVLLMPAHMHLWLALPILVGVTLILADLTYRFVERPAVKLQHKLFPHRSVTFVLVPR